MRASAVFAFARYLRTANVASDADHPEVARLIDDRLVEIECCGQVPALALDFDRREELCEHRRFIAAQPELRRFPFFCLPLVLDLRRERHRQVALDSDPEAVVRGEQRARALHASVGESVGEIERDVLVGAERDACRKRRPARTRLHRLRDAPFGAEHQESRLVHEDRIAHREGLFRALHGFRRGACGSEARGRVERRIVEPRDDDAAIVLCAESDVFHGFGGALDALRLVLREHSLSDGECCRNDSASEFGPQQAADIGVHDPLRLLLESPVAQDLLGRGAARGGGRRGRGILRCRRPQEGRYPREAA